MARRGRSRETGTSAYTNDIASPELDGLLDPLPALPVDPVSSLDNFLGPSIPFDQRAFSMTPEGSHDAHVRPGARHVSGVVVRRDVLAEKYTERTAREDGVRTAICVRRSTRREVLHALKRVRKRGGGGQRYRSWRSDIKC